MQPREEGADDQVVDVGQRAVPPQLLGEVGLELLQVRGVGADGMGGGVALAVEIAEEPRDLRAHTPAAASRTVPASTRGRKASRESRARAEIASRLLLLSRIRTPRSGRIPKAMLVGW